MRWSSRRRSRRIIVDTCLGNDKEGRRIPTWNKLQTGRSWRIWPRPAIPRETIDTVLCTHLHVDHVGWNTMLVDGTWVPTFPKARYLMGRVEFEHWSSQHEREDMPAVFADSVTPVFEAGLVDLVETDHRICDEISLIPTSGHTPGHVSVRDHLAGRGGADHRRFHAPSLPDRPPGVVVDGGQRPRDGAATRERILPSCRAPVLVIGTHFAGATAGRVVRDGELPLGLR